MHWYEKNVMGTGPFIFVEHVKGSHWVGKKNPNYWDKGKPYLDGFRAIFISSSAAQVAAIRGERAHDPVPRLQPAGAGQLVSALGNKITVQESPWDCRSCRRRCNHEKKPFDDKRVRRALSLALDRYEGSQKALQDHHRQGRGRRPGAGHAVRDAARRAGEAGRLRRATSTPTRGGGQAAPARGGRAGRLLVHVQEPRDPACPTSRSAIWLDRPVAADRRST